MERVQAQVQVHLPQQAPQVEARVQAPSLVHLRQVAEDGVPLDSVLNKTIEFQKKIFITNPSVFQIGQK